MQEDEGGTMARLRVREVAQAKGVGMNKLARRADLSIITVRRLWRDDESYDPSLSTLQKTAAALSVSVQELLVQEEEEQ